MRSSKLLSTLTVLAVALFIGLTASSAGAEKPEAPPKGPPAAQPGPGPSIERELLRPESPKPDRAAPPKPPKGLPPGKPPKPPTPEQTLRYGTPEEAGLLPRHIGEIDADVEAGLEFRDGRQAYPGAVVLAGRNGVIAKHDAYGHALAYEDPETLLLEDERVPMERGTVFDLASVSKLFTSIAALQLVERGSLDLDAPVAEYIPEFAENGKESVTVRQLLTHTSGLPAWLPLYSEYGTVEERLEAVYTVEPESEAGSEYRYSDLNMITLGKIVESQSGLTLDVFVERNITQPLGMRDTGYNPPESEAGRIAATEWQPYTGRGMVRGSVHDENAWSLGGVAGHAGIFGTARDLAVLAQAVMNGGSYGDARILRPESVEKLITNYNEDFPGNDHGLGLELYQHWYMDAMATPASAGHTGFTGTSMVLNPAERSFAILLTNRVHPTRETESTNPYRRAVARDVACAVPVDIPGPPGKGEAWFSGLGDDLDRTLTFPVELPEGGKELAFDLWYDTEPGYDFGAVEISSDGGESWSPLPGALVARDFEETVNGRFSGWSGRQWLDATFDLGEYSGDALVRFRYTTDATSGGRGVYVDRVRIKGGGPPIFDDRRPGDRELFRSDGWELSRD